MNLPNFLTCFRIVLAFVFLIILPRGGYPAKLAALSIFLLAVGTDYWDGKIARRKNLITNFGKIMDPIADKFLTLSAFYVFSKMSLLFSWMFWAILIREVVVTLTRLSVMRRGKTLAAESLGKIKTVTQMVSIGIALIYLLFLESPQLQGWTTDTACIWVRTIFAGMVLSVLLTLISGITFFTNNKAILYER